jgi:predicted Holliday junction resolvase-like endonuclease
MGQSILPACLLLLIIVAGVVTSLFSQNKRLKEEAKHWQNKHDTVLSQKKSSEVRLGMIGENLAPFTDSWPYEPGNFIFIGREIDGLQINDDSIVFIEIKTGKSRLSKSQKNIKSLIKEGKVYFETFRIDADGCKLTRH